MVRWFLLAALCAAPAYAYPWMVKHGYGSCATCHVDPSGSGQLTPYGRAQADVLVKWRVTPRKEDEEVPKSANFLWFLELPDALNLSGNLRYGSLVRPASTPFYVPLPMAADLYATVNLGPVVAHVTTGVGIATRAASLSYFGPAALAPSCTNGSSTPVTTTGAPCTVLWLAREFWAGVKLADEAVVVRGGRMNLPFGLRNSEHTSWVRALTRTDVNVQQQVGAAVSYSSDSLRGELMGIAGNFQFGPDAYRERGYSAYAEYSLAHNAYVGLSSLITHAEADPLSRLPVTRHAHGAFARLAPTDKLALLAEADFLAWQTPGVVDRLGFAALVQGDYSLMQGLHVMATLEGAYAGAGEAAPRLGGWLSASWYFMPHLELRLDNVLRRTPGSGSAVSTEYQLLIQLHAFL